ncbi:MAG: glycoside-pentoside-hexuronide (GPH):cation symporter [Oscillospiraceae bacterium]|nr:glycoside-pentoside-hexuronide (GPH):cation symporter [Oscillospiraceae bacterium]
MESNPSVWKKLPRWVGFGVGALGMDLSYGLFNTYLAKYQTDILLLPPVFLAVLTFFAHIWDGVNDPLMGVIVDNTHSKHGKYRKWLMIGAFANAAALVLLFWNPGFTPVAPRLGVNVGLCIWASVMYVLWDMTNTIMDIPFWSMVPSLTKEPKERNIAATVPRVFSGLGNLVIVIASAPMIAALGHAEGLNEKGYFRWVVICAAVLIGLQFIAYRTTKRIPALSQSTVGMQSANTEKFSLKRAYKTVIANDQLLVFMLVAVLCNTGWYLMSGLSTYYFEDVRGNLNELSFFGLLVGAGQAAGLVLIPLLTKWLKRNTVIALAICMAIAGYLGMFTFSVLWDVSVLFALFGFIGMMGIGCCFVSQTIMLSDIVDYTLYKLGYRADSIVFSMKGFLQKGAYCIQTLIMFLGLEIIGYDGAIPFQTPKTQWGIINMMFLIPPVLAFCGLLVFLRRYKLDEDRMKTIKAVCIDGLAEYE